MMLYLIRGLPGSGKSTLAKELLANHTVQHHYEADMYFMKEGEYKFDPKQLGDAHAWCMRCVEEALASGHNVAVSNTFTRINEIDPYAVIAKNANTSMKIITCTGNYGSVHGVPEHTIQNMARRFVSHSDVCKQFGISE